MDACLRAAAQPMAACPAHSCAAFCHRPALLGLPWIQAPLHDVLLRQKTQFRAWTPSVVPERLYAAPGAALPQQLAAGGSSSATAPPDLFQSALISLDLFEPTSQADVDDAGPPEDIAVEYGPTAASVGRAIYEVLRIDTAGRTRRIYVKRRDLLRANGLQPRDLRRIDPSQSLTKTSPNITVKEAVLLTNLGGVRTIVRADKCLLFEPNSPCSRKFLDIVCPRLQDHETARRARAQRLLHHHGGLEVVAFPEDEEKAPPFELEILEAALMVATGRIDAELIAVSKRVSNILINLPRNITPVNLEELRRVKSALVELESKADNLRDMLEELMDDEDEVREMNLSSRPEREERRRLRERERLERGAEREREIARSNSASSSSADAAREDSSKNGNGRVTVAGAYGSSTDGAEALPTNALDVGTPQPLQQQQQQPQQRQQSSSGRGARWDGERDRGYDEEGEGYVEAEAALEEMDDADAEEREVEETEDLLEYYLQRAAGTRSEAERLLAGARDLEESIGVSLSARRFEVNRLELTLSIGSFSAALGAVVAGIFGMNLRSTLENSIVGFWGTTIGIVLCCLWVAYALFAYTRRRRIL